MRTLGEVFYFAISGKKKTGKKNKKRYDWVILVGSEPFKFFTGKSSVTEYAGKIVDEKFIPTINPAMLAFKPEAKKLWENSVAAINDYVTGKRVHKTLI